MTRYLTPEEIEDIISFIPLSKSIPEEIALSVREEQRYGFRIQLKNGKMYPEDIPRLKEILRTYYFSSLVEPGKMAGADAACSIGESNTQATLKSFHKAGQLNLSLLMGVPWLKELLNAVKYLKTPSNTIYFNHPKEKLKDLQYVKELTKASFEYKTVYNLIVDYDCRIDRKKESWYELYEIFHSTEYHKCSWSIRLTFNLDAIFREGLSLLKISEIIEETYQDSFCVFSPDNIGIIDVYIDTEHISSPEDIINELKKVKNTENSSENEGLALIVDDDNKEEFFIKKLVLYSLLHLPICGIEGIEKIYFQETSDGEWFIQTKGSNFKKVIIHPDVDPYRTTSNNMWDIYECFGIEAVHEFLTREFKKVITIGDKHLSILTFGMTQNGKIQPVNRYGIDRKQVGTMAKIAFEEPYKNIFQSALSREGEDTSGISSSITLGKYASMGSHMCDIVDEDGEPINEAKIVFEETRKLEKKFANNRVGNMAEVKPQSKPLPKPVTNTGSVLSNLGKLKNKKEDFSLNKPSAKIVSKMEKKLVTKLDTFEREEIRRLAAESDIGGF